MVFHADLPFLSYRPYGPITLCRGESSVGVDVVVVGVGVVCVQLYLKTRVITFLLIQGMDIIWVNGMIPLSGLIH